jgi:GntR family transcriptional regulator, transcriptional repressor for pyruvate dehydrogenase complex
VYKLVRSSRLYEQIVQQIEESIVKGDLKPGDQLPAERELAQRFGVSRTAVREAVKALREKGLVEAYSGRGTFITDGTTQAVRQSLDLMVKIGQPEGSTHLAEVRAILEPEIAARAATRIQESELTTMREAVAVMEGAFEDPDAYIEADLDFHLALAEGARFDCRIAARAEVAHLQSSRRAGAWTGSSQADSRGGRASRRRRRA